MNKFAIFGFPRSATKLLANVYKQRGYFSFGEFFDVYSSEITTADIPYAIRLPIKIQKWLKYRRHEVLGSKDDDKVKIIESEDRATLFKNYNISPSIVTVWSENFDLICNLHTVLLDRYFLCTRRKNKTDQILSRLITYYHLNYNAEIQSSPLILNLNTVSWFCNSLLRTEKMQDEIVKNNRGRYVDFDKLISGKEDLGFDYVVDSIDEHPNLEQLIINLSDVKEKINSILVNQ